MVYFLEEKHEYFNVYGYKYISVSGLMHEYINDFNKVLRSEIRLLETLMTLYIKKLEKNIIGLILRY